MNLLSDWLASNPLGTRCAAVAQIATASGVTSPAVRHWINGTRPLPISKASIVESCTGIPCEALFPEVHWVRDDEGRVTGYRVDLHASVATSEPTACLE